MLYVSISKLSLIPECYFICIMLLSEVTGVVHLQASRKIFV